MGGGGLAGQSATFDPTLVQIVGVVVAFAVLLVYRPPVWLPLARRPAACCAFGGLDMRLRELI